jgi:Glycosyltransferase 61
MTINLPPSSTSLGENHGHTLLQEKSTRIPRHGEFCVRTLGRRSSHKVFLPAILLVVSVLLARNLSFHQSSVADNQNDFYYVSHMIEDAKTNDTGTNINTENELWNDTSLAHLPLPTVPWPIESDGCNIEDGTRPYCKFHNFLIDLSRVNSVSIGGESLVPSDNNETRTVMGQAEDDEYLYYLPGAFQSFSARKAVFPIDQYLPSFAYVNDVLNSLQVIDINETPPVDMNCTRFFSGSTLFIQRYEYVNLYHTLTDWWNTWTVYRHLQPAEIANVAVVFLDSHPAGNLDHVWTALFGESVHLRRLDDSNFHTNQTANNLCFERAMLVPPGYISLLWPQPVPDGGLFDPRAHEMMKDFVYFFLDKMRLTHVHKIPGRVVIIDRKPYLAHPRSQLVDDRALNNLPEVADAILQKIPNVTSVLILQLHNMTFREQVEAVREAEVLVGVHGAGLTHLVFMDDASHVVEFQMNLDFFVHLAQCKSGQVTLHQIPFIAESVPESFLDEFFLPTFAKIYGLEERMASESDSITTYVRTKV